MPKSPKVMYHRDWPRLLREAAAENAHDPFLFVWDNVDDLRTYEVGYAAYMAALQNWCSGQSKEIYQTALQRHREAA